MIEGEEEQYFRSKQIRRPAIELSEGEFQDQGSNHGGDSKGFSLLLLQRDLYGGKAGVSHIFRQEKNQSRGIFRATKTNNNIKITSGG